MSWAIRLSPMREYRGSPPRYRFITAAFTATAVCCPWSGPQEMRESAAERRQTRRAGEPILASAVV